MLKFTDYLKNSLNEELTEKQKRKVDDMPRMDYSVKKLHDKVFGDSDRIIIPYQGTNDDGKINSTTYGHLTHYTSNTHHVMQALSSKGYVVNDYESGLASHISTPDRHMKIGKILEKEGIANHLTNKTNKKGERQTLKQLYDADPVRGAGNNQKQIVISRNRYDVAGMSTDRGWSSCMSMDGGCNKHYLQHDMKHGTLS